MSRVVASGMITISAATRLVMARYDGKLSAVGHVSRGWHGWTAVLYARAEYSEPVATTVTRATLGELRQALRDRVREQGRWWT